MEPPSSDLRGDERKPTSHHQGALINRVVLENGIGLQTTFKGLGLGLISGSIFLGLVSVLDWGHCRLLILTSQD